MIIDSSALLAILLGEAEVDRLIDALTKDPKRLMSAFSFLESAVVIQAKKGAPGGRELDLLVHKARIEIVALSVEQVELARMAYVKYGRGTHPASLNIGDCCSYALAKYSGEPLLFKGGDFSKSDIAAVIY